MTGPAPDVVYRGHGPRAGGGLVTLEGRDGSPLGVLRHVVRHSPTGLSWGYGGSGPADLARSLLLDALGDAAHCTSCARSGKVVYLADVPDPVPFDPERHADLDEDAGFIDKCWECDGDGYRLVPYHDYKFEVVAGLPAAGWTLSRQSVLTWLARRGVAVPS